MSKVVQFNFEKNHDKEIDINGTVYSIPMDDTSKEKYVKATKKFGIAGEEIAKSSASLLDMSDEEISALTAKQCDMMKDLIETILGKGTFKTMYALAGKSALKLMPLAQELLRLVSDLDEETYAQVTNKYLQNGKK
ncbi:hypothetical protein HWB81_gp44 [Bacillus phage Wes44]|uniref:Tail assembly chaperone n=1 Tax=Bacillus phage Wes44 TaxID=2283012 RepID=A0A346FK48_9CAUD|nr:hypothetical protein HWB81_gp44 [Bacillus phage Wes44]AXN58353.1 hypothetical protein Wes44_44 [Bacillus phage Wes44]